MRRKKPNPKCKKCKGNGFTLESHCYGTPPTCHGCGTISISCECTKVKYKKRKKKK